MNVCRVMSVLCLALAIGAPAAAQAPSQEQQRIENLARELERARDVLNRARLDEQRAREIGELYAQLQQVAGGRGRSGGPGPQSTFDPRTTDPMSAPVVANAPFSADAITVVTQTLGDGTNITQRATAKFYRDGTGRIRREQTVMGIDALNPRAPGQPIAIVTVDSEPGDPRPYQLDATARTARRVPRSSASSPGGVGGGVTLAPLYFARDNRVAIASPTDQVDMPVNFQGLTIPRRGIPADLRPNEEQLGTRNIEGVKATGKRVSVTIPTDRVGNDRPIVISDERWESPELGVVVYSKYTDPRTGVVEFHLTGINRSEPAASLFTIPADWTTAAEPGARGRGVGGGGRGDAPGGRGGRTGGPPQQ